MLAPGARPPRPAVTTGPITGSTKVYRDGVPFRRVHLTNGEHVDLYDTSGPYTDPDATIDVHKGLQRPREPWALDPVNGAVTQLAYAKAGVLTREMRFVAAREGVDPEFVRAEVARGRAVIPVNRNHRSEERRVGKE